MSTDQGTTTRIDIRLPSASPPVAAGGPTPGLPTTNNGEYVNTYGQDPTSDINTQILLMPHSLTAQKAKAFKMCGQDHNTNGLFDTWVVYGYPDLTGSQYAGALATPLRDVFICG